MTPAECPPEPATCRTGAGCLSAAPLPFRQGPSDLLAVPRPPKPTPVMLRSLGLELGVRCCPASASAEVQGEPRDVTMASEVAARQQASIRPYLWPVGAQLCTRFSGGRREAVVRVQPRSSGRKTGFAVELPGFKALFGWYLLNQMHPQK